jgi:ribosome maturation factor RimP
MGLGPIFCFLDVMNKVPQGLQTLVSGVVDSLGYELWGVELLPRPKSGQLLRVYIETRSQTAIGLTDCEKVSRQLSAVLDVEDPIAGDYTLEVSSPGMDRPLYGAEQFVRFVGETVRVKLRSSVVGRKNYRGKLLAVEQGQIRILVDGEQFTLAIGDIDSAHVVPQF